MESIGVRQLSKNPSQVMHAVEDGASYRVTLNGRPVAIISPIPRQDDVWRDGAITMDRMRASSLPPDPELWVDILSAREHDAARDRWDES